MSETFSGVERRITLRLLSYWERLRKGRDMPALSDVRPEDIGDLWQNCFLIHINNFKKNDYRYTYIGDRIVEAYRGELSKDDGGMLVSPDVLKLAKPLAEVIATRRPVIVEGEMQTALGQPVRYRQCFLPLGSGSRVEGVLGGMRYRVFA
jgi:hypothetical protein